VNSHVIPGLIHKFYLARKNNTAVTVAGTGKPLRQFIYSKDLAKLIVWALFNYNNDPTPLMLCVDESDELSIAQIVNMIAAALGFRNEIIVSHLPFDDMCIVV
jgi:GDP-L-fucose synthase